MNAADYLYTHVTGPMASVRGCLLCKHYESIPVNRRNVGRGYGMREGNKARGKMIQHIKECHPRELEAVAGDVGKYRAIAPGARATVLRRALACEAAT